MDDGVFTTLLQDMAQFLGEPVDVVKRKAVGSEVALVGAWREHQGGAASFYWDNPLYLYNLLYFNLTPNYLTRLARICTDAIGPRERVLDVGCGLGTLSFLLAQRGNWVWGYEINERCLDFARWRRATRFPQFSLPFVGALPGALLKGIDTVLAVDTLEHIENLRLFLNFLGQGLKPGAQLIHLDRWDEPGVREAEFPMHFDHEKQIDGWLQAAGFQIANPVLAVKGNNGPGVWAKTAPLEVAGMSVGAAQINRGGLRHGLGA